MGFKLSYLVTVFLTLLSLLNMLIFSGIYHYYASLAGAFASITVATLVFTHLIVIWFKRCMAHHRHNHALISFRVLWPCVRVAAVCHYLAFSTAISLLMVLCCQAAFGIKVHFITVCMSLPLYLWGVKFCGLILQRQPSHRDVIRPVLSDSTTEHEICRLKWTKSVEQAHNLVTQIGEKLDDNSLGTLPGTFAYTILVNTVEAMMTPND